MMFHRQPVMGKVQCLLRRTYVAIGRVISTRGHSGKWQERDTRSGDVRVYETTSLSDLFTCARLLVSLESTIAVLTFLIDPISCATER
jgi:hypothetical protein